MEHDRCGYRVTFQYLYIHGDLDQISSDYSQVSQHIGTASKKYAKTGKKLNGTESGYHQATKLDIREVVQTLKSQLGTAAVVTLCGCKDTKRPTKWVKADGPMPSQSSQDRLRAAFRAWHLITETESVETARVWFMTSNPFLGEISPVLALHDGKVAEVMAAAKNFVTGTRQA